MAATPAASATRRALRMPPRGCTLRITASAASRWRRRVGVFDRPNAFIGRQLDPNPSTQAGQGVDGRRRAARRARCRSAPFARALVSAVSSSQAPLASTRNVTDGPSASRTADTSARSLLGSRRPTLIFTHRNGASAAGSNDGSFTSALTGTTSRTVAGHGCSAASSAAASGARLVCTGSHRGAASTHPIHGAPRPARRGGTRCAARDGAGRSRHNRTYRQQHCQDDRQPDGVDERLHQ